jgi:hypothetical protein
MREGVDERERCRLLATAALSLAALLLKDAAAAAGRVFKVCAWTSTAAAAGCAVVQLVCG